MKNLIVFVSAVSTLLFSSCAKKIQPMPGVPDCRIKSFNDSTGNPLFYINYLNSNSELIKETYTIDSFGQTKNRSTYYYNTLNKLDSVVFANKDKWCYSYNSHNKISKITKYHGWHSEYGYFGYSIFSYDYDSELNLKSKIESYITTTSFSIPDTVMFSNYQNGRPQKIETSYGFYEYEYDDFGNVLKEYLTKRISNTKELAQEFTYDYSNDLSSIIKTLQQLRLAPTTQNMCPDPNLASINFSKHLILTSKSFNPDITHQSQFSTNKYGNVKSYKFYSKFWGVQPWIGLPIYTINTSYHFSYGCE